MAPPSALLTLYLFSSSVCAPDAIEEQERAAAALVQAEEAAKPKEDEDEDKKAADEKAEAPTAKVRDVHCIL